MKMLTFRRSDQGFLFLATVFWKDSVPQQESKKLLTHGRPLRIRSSRFAPLEGLYLRS